MGKKSVSYDYGSIRHGTGDYLQTVVLREEVLRRPLNLTFTPAELDNEKGSFHLAGRLQGELVACLVLLPLSKYLVRMRQMAVRRNLQGSGLGTGLVHYSETFVYERGFREIVLHARATATGFYEKLGYHIDSKPFTEVGIPHHVMRKVL